MKKPAILLFILLAGLPLWIKAQAGHPAIAIPFTLKENGYVTLVIEDKNGVRVRNLIAETWFKAGQNTAWWDGLDDLGRDTEAAHHGIYSIPGKPVTAGSYTVKGLVHPEIKTTYEFSIYTAGKIPWNTKDHTGGWMANHTAPQAAVFVPAANSPTKQPAVFLGSYVTEGNDGLIWVDLEGNKQGGKKWIGGAWTAAPYLARDAGEKAVPNVSVYTASVWETIKGSGKLDLRLSTYPRSDQPILTYPIGTITAQTERALYMGGMAVNNGIAVVSIPIKNQLLFIDAKIGKVISTVTVDAPSGLAFDSNGSLLVISGKKLFKYDKINDLAHLSGLQPLITSGLEAPVAVTTDANGKIYVSDGGKSHQVKVFSAAGKFLLAIGKPGVPSAGPYDPLHMNNPAGITIDSQQHLWVTENDFLPKRVSVWSLDGKLIDAFYGPSKYGGGGVLDSQNQNSYYYAEEEKGAMRFKLDWQNGEAKLASVIYRKTAESLELPLRSAGPEMPLYDKGKRYFTNSFNSSPTGGALTAVLFVERNGLAYPAVAMGAASAWPILKTDPKNKQFFIWVDQNGDAKVQPSEVTYQKGVSGGITVMPDLSFCVANLNGKAMKFSVLRFTPQGVPVYQLDHGSVLVNDVLPPASTGGNQVLSAPDGWTVVTQGIKPFSAYSISGAKGGKPLWSYPNLWPGLHASHEAPVPGFAGELVGPTHLLGNYLEIKGSDAGPLWAINSNHGMVYIFTTDGLFVSALFEPMRTGTAWNMPVATRGMSLKGVSLAEENFWPSITQIADGNIYLADGNRSSLVKIDGLQKLKRLPVMTIAVTAEDLRKSSLLRIKSESDRQQGVSAGPLTVAMLKRDIVVDGKLDDWKGLPVVDIDKRGVKAYFNAKTKPYDVTGAVAVSGNKLYASYHTGEAALLRNSGEAPLAFFKTGGALDLMIGTNSSSDPQRKTPVAGDVRLLVTLIKGKPKALLYRAVVPGTKAADQVPFSSPSRTITLDNVQDITSQVEFAAGNNGDFEISVPLSLLNLKPVAGMSVKGDIGILRGDGMQTLSRVYWSNKATAIVSDVPSEAEFTPNLWGMWKFSLL